MTRPRVEEFEVATGVDDDQCADDLRPARSMDSPAQGDVPHPSIPKEIRPVPQIFVTETARGANIAMVA